jgi:hypothetical protein
MSNCSLRSKSSLLVGGIVVVGALVGSADPAAAHHSPEDFLRAEQRARELDTLRGQQDGGVPIWLIVAATVALAAVFLMRRHGLPRPSRRGVAVIAVASMAAVPLAAVASVSAATILLPDLISDEPDPVGGVQVNNYTGEPRLILRFDGYVTNVGQGALEVSGNPSHPNALDPAAVHQRAIDTDGVWNVVGTPTVQFESDDSHDHFHLMEVARYSLWNLDKTAQVAPGQKVGFCLYDIEWAEEEDFSGTPDEQKYTGAVTQFCDTGDPLTTDLVMGTSAGWRDVYTSNITFQWVDVSETAPGVYWLASEADPLDRVVESNENNNQIAFAETTSVVPGYNALPVGPVSTGGGPVGITLSTESFGSPGGRVFEIASAPEHGDLGVAVGVPFASTMVTYTPDSGYKGCDSFDYLARSSTSAFPLNPTTAAVSIQVGAACPAVAISGAPESLIAGTSVDLTPTVVGADPGVVWSVDGDVGGNETVGTISDGGLYIAPAMPPPGGQVTIRASLAADPLVFDEVVIAIEPVPNDAPLMSDPGDQTSTVHTDVNLVIGASDPNGDPFGFTATGLPAGLSIHPSTGVISGSPTSPGRYLVEVVADDGLAQSQVAFEWTILPGFVDVDWSSWYGPSVVWMVQEGITTGTSPVTFSPDRDVTRAEAVTFLWRWVGEPAAPPAPFTDLAPGAFYLDAVAWAAHVGVTQGTSATTFEPDATMTRAQLATFFHRLAGMPPAVGPPPFGDVPLDRYFTDPIAWLAEQGLTTGVAPGVFDTYGVVTRAQFSTVLCRYSASPAAAAPGALRGASVCDPTS